MAAGKRVDDKGRKLPDNVRQRSDGVYQWRKAVDGTTYYESSKDLGELKRKITQAMYDIEHGTADKNPLENITLDEWYKKWFAAYKQGFVKEATAMKYNRDYNKHISPILGSMKIKDIKNIHVAEMVQTLESRDLSGATINHSVYVLSDMMSRAAENDLITRNPTGRNSYSKKPSSRRPRRALTRDEQNALIEFLGNSVEFGEAKNFFIVLLGTGMRIGEITGLTEKDVDFKKNIIKVTHQLTYEGRANGKCEPHISAPKTKTSTRDIPMLSGVKAAIKEQIKYNKANIKRPAEVDGYTGFIFCNPYGRVILKKYTENLIKRIITAYNQQEQENVMNGKERPVFLKPFTPHELRHTFATRCFEAGMKPKAVQEILGHASLQMTMDLYTHVVGDVKAEEMEKMEDMF